MESVGQEVERNGVLYRDFQFRTDSINFDQILKSENKLISKNEDSLPFIKNDFIVNSFDGEYGADQTDVSAAIDGNGNYAFTWIDYRNGIKEIYAQFYNSNDERIGLNFNVNEYPLSGNNSPYIAANSSNDFVIVWLQSFQDVFAQRFSNDGDKIGQNFKVNTISGFNTKQPCVAVNDDGSFMIMWATDLTYSETTVYARLFDSFGNPQGSEIIVSEPGHNLTSFGPGKQIAVDGDGNYCVTWSGISTNYISNIYIQLINSTGQKIGTNTTVNSLTDSSDCYFPEIVSTNDGHLLIVWFKRLRYQINEGTSARIYHTDNHFVTDEFEINEPDIWGDGFTICSDKDTIFLIAFYADINSYFQMISSKGNYIGDTVRVSYDSGIAGYAPIGLLTDIYNNKFYMVPQIYKGNDANLYSQKFDTDFTTVGAFNKIHDDIGSSSQKKSFVKFNKLGGSIVLWEDQRNGRFDLYAQVYDAEFNPMGGNIQINETDKEYWLLQNKTAESLSDGTFVIAFSGDENYSTSSAFLQLVSNSGEKIGNNKLVKESNNYYKYDVFLSVDSNDEILVCWYNQNGASMRIFDKNLNNIIPEKTLLHSSNNISFNPITVSVDSLFNIFISYVNYDYQNYSFDNKIRGKFFDKNGNGSSGFIIDSVNSYIAEFICKNIGNNFVIFYRDGTKIYLKRIYDKDNNYTFENIFSDYSYSPTQLNIVEFDNQKVFVTYNSNLDVIGFYANDNRRETESYLLHQYEFIDPYFDNYNGSNSSDILNDKIIFSYENPGNEGTGYDIWANVRKIENVNFESELFYPPADYDVLYNNFPNPFNSKTKIAYELLSYHNVKLIVYDILGREVKILVNENQEKGLYEVEFDASSLASGIYFYKLEAFNTTVKKMLLLK